MDYSDDAFHTFLYLDSAIYYAVNGTVTNLPVFIQNLFQRRTKLLRVWNDMGGGGGGGVSD